LPDSTDHDASYPSEPGPRIIKGAPLGGQAEKLVRVRRRITRTEEMTRLEKIENEAREKAETILAEASKQAEEIVGKAKGEADSIRSKARQDGDLAAKREALQKLEGLISDLKTEINSLRTARTDFLKENLPGVMDFACAVAGKIMVSELATRPDSIAKRARALLERMPSGSPVTLSACPDDIEVIERYLHETDSTGDGIMPSLRSDPSMKPGDITLQSDSGRIDAKLLDALEEIGSLLNDQAGHIAQFGDEGPEEKNGG